MDETRALEPLGNIAVAGVRFGLKNKEIADYYNVFITMAVHDEDIAPGLKTENK